MSPLGCSSGPGRHTWTIPLPLKERGISHVLCYLTDYDCCNCADSLPLKPVWTAVSTCWTDTVSVLI